jgi:hypothetical protein
MIWQDLNQRRYSVWIYLVNQVSLVNLKDFPLIVLMSKVFKFINVDFMVVRTQISMALKTEQIEEVIINQVIQTRRKLNHLQV